jgi:hypothetical protein
MRFFIFGQVVLISHHRMVVVTLEISYARQPCLDISARLTFFGSLCIGQNVPVLCSEKRNHVKHMRMVFLSSFCLSEVRNYLSTQRKFLVTADTVVESKLEPLRN